MLSNGISKNKIKLYESEVGISYLLNIVLPLFLGKLTQSELQMIGDVDRVRKLRNDIVHEGKDITLDDALFAINAVNTLVHHLKKNYGAATIPGSIAES